MDKEKIIKALEPFAEQAKFASSEGPGYLRKKDWVALKVIYEDLLNAPQPNNAGGREIRRPCPKGGWHGEAPDILGWFRKLFSRR